MLAAWKTTQGLRPDGSPVIVAVIDSGVSPHQKDLEGAIAASHYFDGSGNSHDQSGHGTVVATLIAARANDGWGIAGVCPQCQLLNLKAGTPGQIAAAIDWAVAYGASVVNISQAFPNGWSGMAQAIKRATKHGVLVVAGAGNDGQPHALYPARYGPVLSVGWTDQDGRRDQESNYGSTVDVGAPGWLVADSKTGSADLPAVWGTSFSSALVAGTAALVYASHPDFSAEQVADAICSSAHPSPKAWACGRVDAAAAALSG